MDKLLLIYFSGPYFEIYPSGSLDGRIYYFLHPKLRPGMRPVTRKKVKTTGIAGGLT